MDSDASKRVETAVAAYRDGKMVVLVDDADRENEGDLCLAAERVTAEAINFMAKHARGLICLSLDESQVSRLHLPMMSEPLRDSGLHERRTAFTVSIEAKHNVTTGISAADRAETIRVASDPQASAEDLVSPGHVFPLRARSGGVLQRAGHTEGSVDLAGLAGLRRAAVICEIMNDDGTMARLPELERFAAKHAMPILSIADLIAYRSQQEKLVHRLGEYPVVLASGAQWRAIPYALEGQQRKFVAFALGDLGPQETLVRVHAARYLSDALGLHRPHGLVLARAAEAIEREGRGVILCLPSSQDLAEELETANPPSAAQPKGVQVHKPSSSNELREYGLGAQILADLGLRDVRLITNRPRRIPSLEGYNLRVLDQVTLAQLSN